MKASTDHAPVARARPKTRLEASRILVAAAKLLEAGGSDFSMRELARALGVDPMALYHYFPNKTALLHALADQHFARLGSLDLPEDAQTPLAKLRCIAQAYVDLAVAAPMLTVVMARDPGARDSVAGHFARLFHAAVAGLGMTDAQARIAMAVFADYLNGFSIAGIAASDPSLLDGVDCLYRGLAPHISR